MRFKGVVTKKGKERGDVIEYSPEEKVRVALAVAITKYPDFEAYLVNPAKVVIEQLQTSKKGDPLKKLWQNNFYEASGRIEVARRHKEKDKILRPVPYQFTIKVQDCLCNNGLPDLDTVSIDLVPA